MMVIMTAQVGTLLEAKAGAALETAGILAFELAQRECVTPTMVEALQAALTALSVEAAPGRFLEVANVPGILPIASSNPHYLCVCLRRWSSRRRLSTGAFARSLSACKRRCRASRPSAISCVALASRGFRRGKPWPMSWRL